MYAMLADFQQFMFSYLLNFSSLQVYMKLFQSLHYVRVKNNETQTFSGEGLENVFIRPLHKDLSRHVNCPIMHIPTWKNVVSKLVI